MKALTAFVLAFIASACYRSSGDNYILDALDEQEPEALVEIEQEAEREGDVGREIDHEHDTLAEPETIMDSTEVDEQEELSCRNDSECLDWCGENGYSGGGCWQFENEAAGTCVCAVVRFECECQ